MTHKHTIEEAAEKLACALETYQWFFDTQAEGGAIIAYVDNMGKEVSAVVPDTFLGYQVKLGFSQYLIAAETYGEKTIEEALEEFGV
jgi:hypothetical protein